MSGTEEERRHGTVAERKHHRLLCSACFLVRRASGDADLSCSDSVRFTLELEFVQCLANPRYVNCLRPRCLTASRRSPPACRLGAEPAARRRLAAGRLPRLPAVLEAAGVRALPHLPSLPGDAGAASVARLPNSARLAGGCGVCLANSVPRMAVQRGTCAVSRASGGVERAGRGEAWRAGILTGRTRSSRMQAAACMCGDKEVIASPLHC